VWRLLALSTRDDHWLYPRPKNSSACPPTTFKFYFNIIILLTPRSSKLCLFFTLPHQITIWICLLSLSLSLAYRPHAPTSWCDHTNSMLWGVKLQSSTVWHFLQSPVTSFFLLLLYAKDQVSYPLKTTAKLQLCIFPFWSLYWGNGRQNFWTESSRNSTNLSFS
jgi:hypothetical protein